MRILVVGAIQGGTIPIGRAIYKAFDEIGIHADIIDYSETQKEFIEILNAKDQERSYRFHLKNRITLLGKIADFKPDVIFGIAQSPLNDTKMLSQLKHSGIRLCYWFTEDYRLFEYWKNIAPCFDHFFTIQKEPFWQELKQIGCTNYRYLPMAFDTHLECPEKNTETTIPVSFLGAPYPNRVNFFSQFRHPGFQIYGEGWDRHPIPSVVTGNRRVTECEGRLIYHRSFININLHSSAFRGKFGGGDFVNPRTFELAGMGAFQLTDMRKLLTLHFDPAEEIIALSGWEDMKRAVEYFLDHEEEREEIAGKARARVLREHTYQHRAREIVDLLSTDYAD